MNYSRLIRSFSVATGLVGLIAYAGGIVRAQTTPTPEQTPGVEQPDTTPTPVQPTPEVEQPDTTPTPQPPVDGVEQPDATPTPEDEQPDTTPMPQPPVNGVEQPDATTPTDDLLEDSENQSLTELLQQASAAGSFTTLAQAVEAAEIGDALQGTGESYTILAPTDEAFAELPEGALEQLLQPENQGLLRQVLAYHVIPAEVMSDDISTGRVETLGGGIAVQVAEDRIIVNDGSVIQADVQAANGVVHVINRVLMPSELRQQIADLL
ncbi:fasciclin domain-containing protein [Egbenema bharatensis]|uniref:fasciclin domain-containing protein n=1 Tax=Egbenema bharatensis TaxID=3463334 RepID=UPI003A85C066